MAIEVHRATISAQVDARSAERLRELAERDDRSVSWLVRAAVRRFLDGEHERGATSSQP